METLFEMPERKLTPLEKRLAYENEYYPVADRPAPKAGDKGWFWGGGTYRLLTVGPFSKSGKTFWAADKEVYFKDFPVAEFLPYREGIAPPVYVP